MKKISNVLTSLGLVGVCVKLRPPVRPGEQELGTGVKHLRKNADREGRLRNIKMHQHHLKPSVKRREKSRNARKIISKMEVRL